MKINVLTSQWSADGDVFAAGEHEVVPTEQLMRLIAGADAAGVLEVADVSDAERAELDGYVETQADGEAAYEAAQIDGRWSEGNLEQFDIDVASGVRDDTIAVQA